MANNTWSNYTEKTATPVDADEVMARDSTDGKNKRLLFGTFWKWIAKKLNEATISELQTDNKTVIGALNYLNGKTPRCIKHIDVSKEEIPSDIADATESAKYIVANLLPEDTNGTTFYFVTFEKNAAYMMIAQKVSYSNGYASFLLFGYNINKLIYKAQLDGNWT